MISWICCDSFEPTQVILLGTTLDKPIYSDFLSLFQFKKRKVRGKKYSFQIFTTLDSHSLKCDLIWSVLSSANCSRQGYTELLLVNVLGNISVTIGYQMISGISFRVKFKHFKWFPSLEKVLNTRQAFFKAHLWLELGSGHFWVGQN